MSEERPKFEEWHKNQHYMLDCKDRYENCWNSAIECMQSNPSWQGDGDNAKSIKVLSPDDVVENFVWAKAGELAHKYKRDQKWIELGLEACRASGVDQKYFIERYLDKVDVPKNVIVEQAYRDLRDGDIWA